VLALLGIWAGLWLTIGAFAELVLRIRLGKASLSESWGRLKGLPRSAFGTALAHAGVGVTVLGIVSASVWSSEDIRTMQPGDTATIAGFELTLDGYRAQEGPNFVETVVQLTARRGGELIAVMEPTKRRYNARAMGTTEAAIKTRGFSQLYISLGDIGSDGSATVRIFWRPMVTLMWLGAVVMSIGGFLSLSDRRLRVGAPRPGRRRRLAPAE